MSLFKEGVMRCNINKQRPESDELPQVVAPRYMSFVKTARNRKWLSNCNECPSAMFNKLQ